MKIVPVKRLKVNDGPVVPVIALAVDLKWLPSVARETFSKDERGFGGIVA